MNVAVRYTDWHDWYGGLFPFLADHKAQPRTLVLAILRRSLHWSWQCIVDKAGIKAHAQNVSASI